MLPFVRVILPFRPDKRLRRSAGPFWIGKSAREAAHPRVSVKSLMTLGLDEPTRLAYIVPLSAGLEGDCP